MNVLVIANPIAGKGKTGGLVREFVGLLEGRGMAVELRFCEGPGDAHAIAGSVTDHTDRIVVAGGDGTVNDVINGLADPSRVPILHLPTGTANMLGLELGLPRNPERLARILEQGRTKRIDMGLIGDRRFLLVVGAGFDACVTREVSRTRGKSLGYPGYLKPVVKAWASYKPSTLRVVVDGGNPLSGAHVIALKTRYYGGYFRFADEARLDSGSFEIRVFHSARKGALILSGLAAALGRLDMYPHVTRLSGRRIQIESDDCVPVQVDGDYYGTTPVRIELVPGFIPVVAPD